MTRTQTLCEDCGKVCFPTKHHEPDKSIRHIFPSIPRKVVKLCPECHFKRHHPGKEVL